jgi:hypothetical protein
VLDSARAGAHSANDVSVEHDWNATAEDDHFAVIAFLDTEQWLAELRERRQVGRCLVEDPCGRCLIDRKIDAANESAILPREGQQVTIGIDNGNYASRTVATSSIRAIQE